MSTVDSKKSALEVLAGIGEESETETAEKVECPTCGGTGKVEAEVEDPAVEVRKKD